MYKVLLTNSDYKILTAEEFKTFMRLAPENVFKVVKMEECGMSNAEICGKVLEQLISKYGNNGSIVDFERADIKQAIRAIAAVEEFEDLSICKLMNKLVTGKTLREIQITLEDMK